MPTHEEDYEKRAQEAEKMAAATKTDYERDAFMSIAHGWRDLIAERERRRKSGR